MTALRAVLHAKYGRYWAFTESGIAKWVTMTSLVTPAGPGVFAKSSPRGSGDALRISEVSRPALLFFLTTSTQEVAFSPAVPTGAEAAGAAREAAEEAEAGATAATGAATGAGAGAAGEKKKKKKLKLCYRLKSLTGHG